MDKPVDFVLPNGFDNSFVPKASTFTKKRKEARKRLLDVANALMGTDLDDDTLIVSTSGRYEFRNKGIDVYIEAMNRLLRDSNLKKNVLAFIDVPGWVGDPRQDLLERLESGKKFDTPLEVPEITHWLHNMSHDNVLGMLKYFNMHNNKEDKVKLIFLPCYLTSDDGVINKSYYDVVWVMTSASILLIMNHGVILHWRLLHSRCHVSPPTWLALVFGRTQRREVIAR